MKAAPYDEARIAAWANDTHALGIRAYQLLPAGTPDHNDTSHAVDISNDYAVAIKADLDRELAKEPHASRPFWTMPWAAHRSPVANEHRRRDDASHIYSS